MDAMVHPLAHKSQQVCCVCYHRYSRPLLEVWASWNWHPICRPCLDDIGLSVFGVFTAGPKVRCEGQQVLL